jgi:hypothetical protein
MKKAYYWSLDASTSTIGWTLWDSNGKMVEINYLELDRNKEIPPEDRDVYKADIFNEYTLLFKERVEKQYDCYIKNVFIEEPLSSTPVNINTTSLLLSFNGMCRYLLYKIFDNPPIKISVHDSRKLFLPEFVRLVKEKGVMKQVLSFPKGWKSPEKKQYIQKRVVELEPQIEWKYNRNNKLSDVNFDMSDSYVVGFSSLKILGVLQ